MLFSTALLGLVALSSTAQAAFKRSAQTSFFAGGEASLAQVVEGDVHTEVRFLSPTSLPLAGTDSDDVQLYHDRFPDHRVRIKETTGFCDPDVK